MKKPLFPDNPRLQLVVGVLCLLALLLLVVIGARHTANTISDVIAQQARLQLNDRQLDDIALTVDGRNVTLRGDVTEDSVRMRAVDAVAAVAGVGDITNKIIVRRVAASPPPATNRPVAPVIVRPDRNRPVATAPAAAPASPSVKPVPTAESRDRPTAAVTPVTSPPNRADRQVVMPLPRDRQQSMSVSTPPADNVSIRPQPLRPSSVRPRPVVNALEGAVDASTSPVSRLRAASSAPQPYLLQLEVADGAVAATGYLPDDALLASLEQRLPLSAPLQLQQANPAPPQFNDAVTFAALAAGKLSRGKVRIADRQISIEGWSTTPTDNFIKQIDTQLPIGYVLSVQVSAEPTQPRTASTAGPSGTSNDSMAAAGNLPAEPATTSTSRLSPIAATEPASIESTAVLASSAADPLSCQADIDALMGGRTIEFQFASDELQPRSAELLDDIAKAMFNCPNAYLYVVGHTDSVGTQARNLRLSQNRARSVRAYLLGQGLFPEYVIAEGVGEKQPLFSNSTEDGRARNRRIEFSVRSEPTL